MIRVLVVIAALALLALGLGWLADRPGDIAISWQGWQIRTSLMAAALAVLVLVTLLMIAIAVLRTLWRTPEMVSRGFRTRRRSRGFNAVTQGMIAVGSGDARRAQRQAIEAERILGSEPLALLLRAQAAQLSGDRAAAEAAFTAMLDEPETKPLGLRGLFVEARRRGDVTAARALAAEAVRASPTLPWAGTALLEFQSIEKDWTGALATLTRNADARLVDKDTARRHRAVLLTARALDQVERDRIGARTSVLEAVKLAPGLVPAAVLAARLLADGNDIRKAARVIEAAWRISPHPDLAEAYMGVRLGDSARDRLSRMQTLSAQAPGHLESSIALARAALAAREFEVARAALAPVLAGEASERVYMLMADIEEAENGPTGKLREWLARAVRAPRDPAWTADGLVSDNWIPVSPVSGRIDAFEWKTPVERLGPSSWDQRSDDVLADIDEPAQLAPPPQEPAVVPEPPPAPPAPPVVTVAPAAVEPQPPPMPAPAVPPARMSRPPPAIVASRPAPDDPGLDNGEEPARRRYPILG